MCCDGNVPVSVIMGTLYKSGDTALLKRAVESILDQTFTEFEFIICDTGSSGEASAFLDGLLDTRVRLVRRDGCLGLAGKLNLCLREVKGEYIARMDDDDYSHPERLEKELAFLKGDEAAFVGCNVSLIMEGKEAGRRVLPERPRVEDFYFTQPYIHPALMFRREALEAVGGYNESRDCVLCEDYDLLLRLYGAGFTGANIQEALLDYTVPASAYGNRTMCHRANEMKTRYKRFKELGRLPRALPYVVKPVFVGLVPEPLLKRMKERRRRSC